MSSSRFPCSFILLALCGTGVLHAQTPAPERDTLPPPGPEYKLVWEDDFSKDPDGLPDPSRWVFTRGFMRNDEPEYYTPKRLENARIEHGRLIIEVRKEAFKPADSTAEAYGKVWTTKNMPPVKYTSASITTLGKASWTYGRFEIRAKMPKGDIMWPAFWTLGIKADWPHCGEIDLLEMVGADFITGNFHYAIDGKHVSSNFGGRKIPDADTAFHTYTLDWTPEYINLYADGIKYTGFEVKKADQSGENPYRKPHYLLIDLALHDGKIDDSIFPQQLVVEYVKVYQKAGNR